MIDMNLTIFLFSLTRHKSTGGYRQILLWVRPPRERKREAAAAFSLSAHY
jgi:hypothetical protein